jgi:hypothetical protein
MASQFSDPASRTVQMRMDQFDDEPGSIPATQVDGQLVT